MKNCGVVELPHIAETQTIVYTCRRSDKNSVTIFALKEGVKIASIAKDDLNYILAAIPECIRWYFIKSNSVVETSMTNVGMVLHCAPVLMNIGWIESEKTEFKYYYDGISKSVATFLEKIDSERIAVAKALGEDIESVKHWLERTYSTSGNNLFETIQNNASYREIDAPPTINCTWGVQDLAKSRAMLHIAKELEDDNFRIILQSRAGLDYFKPDLEAAKIQLASVTAMMDDIDPDNDHSPDIIHVVSYCEALYLATPDIINDSIKITRTALKEYRRLKKLGLTPDVKTDDIAERTEILETSARKILAAMEETIPDLYSPEGLYIAFVAGWLPVPELWSDSDEFIHAKCWETKMQNGGTHLVDHELLVPLETRINKCIAHNADAEYILKSKYKVLTRV